MRAHGREGRLGRRFLLAAGLTIAVVVPSAAFGGTADFYPRCDWGCAQNISMTVERGKGKKNKRVKAVQLLPVQSQLPDERAADSPDGSGHTHHRQCRPNRNSHRCQGPAQEVALQRAGPRRRRARQQRADRRVDQLPGQVPEAQQDKADFTLEVTLHGGATFCGRT